MLTGLLRLIVRLRMSRILNLLGYHISHTSSHLLIGISFDQIDLLRLLLQSSGEPFRIGFLELILIRKEDIITIFLSRHNLINDSAILKYIGLNRTSVNRLFRDVEGIER